MVTKVKATIDGNSCFLELATSSKFFLVIVENKIGDFANKTPIGTVSSRDVHGNFYENPTYEVKNVTIGTMNFSDVLAVKESEKHFRNGLIWKPDQSTINERPEASGSIGRPLVQKTNLLLDLGNNRIIPIENIHFLKREGFSVDSMQKCLMESTERGLVIKLDTAVGPLKFELNTGATLNAIRASLGNKLLHDSKKIMTDGRGLPFFSTELSLGETHFGSQDIYLIDICDDINWCDGSLGIDFLRKHVVYIDYHDKAIYIGPTSKKS